MSSISPSKENNGGINAPLLSRFCIFAAIFFISFILVSFLNGVLNAMPMDERVRILCVSSAQCVLVFMAAPVLTARLESKNPLATLSLNKTPYWLNVTCIMACYITGISFLNQIIYWNDALTLPDNWNALEQTMRSWEENSRELTNVLLSTTSIGGLISGVLIIGCLTGLSEELFFRGGIQRMLCEVMSKHAAVWVAAFIFSAMHFQFFGFVPRLLLGAFFGYLYIWSGSIWTAVIAHTINNSMVVVFSWLKERGDLSLDFEFIGVTRSGMPWAAIISALALSLFLIKCHSWFLPRKNK